MRYPLLIISVFLCVGVFGEIKTYPILEGLVRQNEFNVTLKPLHNQSGNKETVAVYPCTVNPHLVNQTAYWCQFMATDSAVITVTHPASKDGAQIESKVRPDSKNIQCEQLNDTTIQFVIPGAKNNRGYALEVDINGDREHALHIFVDSEEQIVPTEPSPDSKDSINWRAEYNHDVFVRNPKIIYFGPGVHKPHDLPSAEIKIPSNTTVYLAPGAVVMARLIVDRAENVKILGRGVLYAPLRGVEITYSKNVLIDGLTVINPRHYTVFGGQSRNITIRNLRSFSSHPWSDGIDLMCCRNVLVEDVFLRNNDDAFAFYNHRWQFWGGSSNIKVRRATIFNDLAHPFNIGSHGDDRSKNGELLKGVWVEDCDILSADCDGIFAVRCGDKNRIENIHFENIRIEDVVKASLFNVQVNFSQKYNRAPGNYIKGVWWKNIHYNGDVSHIKANVIKSYDEKRIVRDLYFQDIYICGEKVNVENVH